MSDEAISGKVLALSDAESDDDHKDASGHLTVQDMAAELPATEQYELLQFNEKRRAELKKTFDFACENGKLEAKQTHKIMFTKDERAEYGFGAFEEDLFATCPHCKEDEKMAWPDVIKFLDENL